MTVAGDPRTVHFFDRHSENNHSRRAFHAAYEGWKSTDRGLQPYAYTVKAQGGAHKPLPVLSLRVATGAKAATPIRHARWVRPAWPRQQCDETATPS